MRAAMAKATDVKKPKTFCTRTSEECMVSRGPARASGAFCGSCKGSFDKVARQAIYTV
jgi:hypothetical protein